MKIKYLFIASALVSMLAFGDGPTNTSAPPVKFAYCELLGTTLFGSLTKVTVTIDYGNVMQAFNDTRIKDESGKVKDFNSMVDALNYMGDKGWELAQAYAVSLGSMGQVYHFLLKRKI